MSKTKLSRRQVLGGLTAAVGFPAVVPASVIGSSTTPAPSEQITLGFIGMGQQGTGKNLRQNFLKQADARVLAVCDVDAERCLTAQGIVHEQYGNKDCDAYNDFREILNRDDIDAVAISTPDHWHAIMSIMAAKAGKDVFCEKPTVSIEEGRVVSDVIRDTGRVLQTGTEDRSLPLYHRMAEMVRNKAIGTLHTIRVGLPCGKSRPAHLDRGKTYKVPDGFDYDLWLGPAPKAQYNPARCHFNFRYIYDYAGGILPDWGMHLVDTAQWANDTERTGPVQVEGMGEFPHDGLYDTAYEFFLKYTYDNGVRMIVRTGKPFLRFEGSEGWIESDGWMKELTASADDILAWERGLNDIHLYTNPAGEQRDFLDCVKSRKEPYFPAEIGHRCATVMHIGTHCMQLGRSLQWDPAKEAYVNDAEAGIPGSLEFGCLRSKIMQAR
jgi:predicted dehydrogenase